MFHEYAYGGPLKDLRFQIEGCLMQTGYLSKTRMQGYHPPSALSCSVPCNLKSAIRIRRRGGPPASPVRLG
jgi:hypothetical protein